MTCERVKTNAGHNADYVVFYPCNITELVGITRECHIISSTTLHTKRIAFECSLKQHGTDIIRFSHGASSSRKRYRSAFIPGLHDVCMIFRKTA